MEISRQEYWSGLPFPTPGHLLDPGIEPMSLMSSELPGRFFTTALPGKPTYTHTHYGIFSSVQSLSRVRLCGPIWTVAHQAPLFMEFSRQEYWSGLPFPSPGQHRRPGINPKSERITLTLILLHCRQILNCLSHQGESPTAKLSPPWHWEALACFSQGRRWKRM